MPPLTRYAPGGTVFRALNRGVGRTALFEQNEDYLAFQKVVEETSRIRSTRICAYRLTPNHWHFVVWPEHDGDLPASDSIIRLQRQTSDLARRQAHTPARGLTDRLRAVASLSSVGVIVGLIAALTAAGASADSAAKEKWLSRLTANASRLLADKELPVFERNYVASVASQALAVSGQVEQAIELAKTHFGEANWGGTAVLIAAAQSESDDVTGAFETAGLLPDGPMKQRALILIAARQAQRGDIDEAMSLIDRIADEESRDRALELTIEARIKAGEFQEAANATGRVADPEIRERLRAHAKRIRDKPSPGDADFTERTIAQAREDWGFAGFSERESRFLRLTCQAKIAMHAKDPAAFHRAMDDARRSVKGWNVTERRTATMSLGFLYREFGDAASASRSFRELLASYADSRDEIDFVRVLAARELSQAIVDVMPIEEVHQWAARLSGIRKAGDLIGGLAAALVARGQGEHAERMYGTLKEPRHRFEVAAVVLDTLAKSEAPD